MCYFYHHYLSAYLQESLSSGVLFWLSNGHPISILSQNEEVVESATHNRAIYVYVVPSQDSFIHPANDMEETEIIGFRECHTTL